MAAYLRAKPTLALAPKHKKKSGPTWGAHKTCLSTKYLNNVTNGAISKVNSYVPPQANGLVSVGSGTSGVNVSNGAARQRVIACVWQLMSSDHHYID
ncbi:MAG: hypothetical protein B7X44_06505 [Halothiobacillus sp. 15-55-196]|nr:MAG: hypothetical protein B7X44_06505 [Halothiobacillus sp. 15-55-196]